MLATKLDRPWAAWLSSEPILCTRCAAFVGSWMTHQSTNASAAHFRIVPSFTAASLEAQTAPSCQFPIVVRNAAWMGVGHPGRYGAGMPVRQQVCPLPAGTTHEPGQERTD